MRQCVFPFRSKNVCTLFLPLGVRIRSSAVWGEQDFEPDGIDSPLGCLKFFCFFFLGGGGVFYVFFFSIMVKFIDTPPLRHVFNTDVLML